MQYSFNEELRFGDDELIEFRRRRGAPENLFLDGLLVYFLISFFWANGSTWDRVLTGLCVPLLLPGVREVIFGAVFKKLVWIRVNASFDETGIYAEFYFRKSPEAYLKLQLDWKSFAAGGFVETLPQGVLFVASRLPDRKMVDQILIPARAFASESDRKRFLDDVHEWIEEARLPEHAPLFDLQFERLPDDVVPLTSTARLYQVGAKFFATIILLGLFTKVSFAPEGAVQRMLDVLLMIPVLAVLFTPGNFWDRLLRRLERRRDTHRVTVDGNTIRVLHRIGRISYDAQLLDWHAMAKSGVVEETSTSFFLAYPKKRGRTPIRECWISKRAFKSYAEEDEFRSFLRAKMNPEPQRNGRESSLSSHTA